MSKAGFPTGKLFHAHQQETGDSVEKLSEERAMTTAQRRTDTANERRGRSERMRRISVCAGVVQVGGIVVTRVIVVGKANFKGGGKQ